jgi:hypothetical protein
VRHHFGQMDKLLDREHSAQLHQAPTTAFLVKKGQK